MDKRKISKSYPHACPICRGRGELTEDLAQHEAVVKYDLKDHKIYSCHVCQGQCIIWEYRDEDAPEEISPILTTGYLQPASNHIYPPATNSPWIGSMHPSQINRNDKISG